METLRSMSSRSCTVQCSTTLYLAATEGVSTSCLPLPFAFLVAVVGGWYALGGRWSGTWTESK